MCRKPSTAKCEAHGSEPRLVAVEQPQNHYQQQEEEAQLFTDAISSSSAAAAATEEEALCMPYHDGHHAPRRRSVSPQRYSTWQLSHMQQVWAVHFCLTLSVLMYGAIHNQQRKYISVDPSNVQGNCMRAFVDVLASEDDEGALICCPEGYKQNGLMGICDRTPAYMPFARRLSQFPEAWLLPLFPLLLRGLVRLFQYLKRTLPTGDSSLSGSTYSTTFRRTIFYLSCLLFRGAILYSLFNFLEHLVVPTPDQNESCWYKDFLKSFQNPCSGKAFDYSDHVVLYFAQLMPVALSETLYCLRVPFWKKEHKFMPVLLISCLLYLYFITFLGAYKTSAYFHTPAEIFTGYAVSLLIQLPLCLIQCSPEHSWKKARSYFYGKPASPGYGTLLIQAK